MDQADSRTAIKEAALDLLVRHGYRGMTFGDIAARLGITRANIHYHFGSKAALVDEVLADYVAATTEALSGIWSGGDAPVAARVGAMLAYSRERYRRFNPDAGPVRPWSLISRLRQDEDLLSRRGRQRLADFTTALLGLFENALVRARTSGTLSPQVSTRALSLLLAAIADNAAPITISAGGFERLEETYGALLALCAPPASLRKNTR